MTLSTVTAAEEAGDGLVELSWACSPQHSFQPVQAEPVLGVQDAFLELMLPVIEGTVTAAEEAEDGQGQAEPSSNVQPQVLKALRRRERLARHKKKSQSADESTLFKVLIPDAFSHVECLQSHACDMHAVSCMLWPSQQIRAVASAVPI